MGNFSGLWCNQLVKDAYLPDLPEDSAFELREFWRLWQTENFFECHEVLEELWREEIGATRVFYNGLIHGAVAIYQHRRGNFRGAGRQLMRARWKLEMVPRKYLQEKFHVDSAAFLACVETEIASSLQQIDDTERAGWRTLEATTKMRMQRVLDEN